MPEMAFKGSPLAKARSAVAVAHRQRDPEAIEDANRNFATMNISVEQVQRLMKLHLLRTRYRWGTVMVQPAVVAGYA